MLYFHHRPGLTAMHQHNSSKCPAQARTVMDVQKADNYQRTCYTVTPITPSQLITIEDVNSSQSTKLTKSTRHRNLTMWRADSYSLSQPGQQFLGRCGISTDPRVQMRVESCENASGYIASWSVSQHKIGQLFLDQLAVYPSDNGRWLWWQTMATDTQISRNIAKLLLLLLLLQMYWL